MKQTFIISLLLLTSLTSLAQSTYRVDSSAINAFFEVATRLSDGQDLTDAQWKELLQTGGYALLRDLDLERRISIAFKPSEVVARDSLLAINAFNFDTYTVQHLREVYRQQQEIRQYLSSTDFEELLATARQRVSQFFPQEVDTASFVPALYFTVFQPDAYPQDTTMVADPYAAMKMGEEAFVGTLAHEFYHIYRRRYAPRLSYSYFSDSGGNQYQVLRTLDNLHNEGSADLIDKTHPDSGQESLFSLFLPESFVTKYDSSFYATPQTLNTLDSLLIAAATDTGYVSSEIYQLLDFGGHPQGFYMSSLIKEELGLAPLIDNFDNPVAFVRLYHQAAQQSDRDEFVFSSAAMRYLEQLEQQHFIR